MIDNKAFVSMPHPKPITPRAWGRNLSRFERWAWSPILSFQVGLTAGYISLLYFGVTALFASVPAFRDTAPQDWAIYWALSMVVGAVFAAVGSVSRFIWLERIEVIGASLLTLAVGSYASVILVLAYGFGDIDRATAGAGFVALLVPLLVRTMWLFSQILRPAAKTGE